MCWIIVTHNMELNYHEDDGASETTSQFVEVAEAIISGDFSWNDEYGYKFCIPLIAGLYQQATNPKNLSYQKFIDVIIKIGKIESGHSYFGIHGCMMNDIKIYNKLIPECKKIQTSAMQLLEQLYDVSPDVIAKIRQELCFHKCEQFDMLQILYERKQTYATATEKQKLYLASDGTIFVNYLNGSSYKMISCGMPTGMLVDYPPTDKPDERARLFLMECRNLVAHNIKIRRECKVMKNELIPYLHKCIEIEYRPDGAGMKKAQEHFNSLANLK